MGKEREYGVWCDKTNTQEAVLKGCLVYRYPANDWQANRKGLLLDAGWWQTDTGNFNVNLNLEIPTEGEVMIGCSQRSISRALREHFKVRRSITAVAAKKAREKAAQKVNVQFYALIPECPSEEKMAALPQIIEDALVIEE